MTAPEEAIEIDIRPIVINKRVFKKVVIDLRHINFGKNGIIQRSHFEIKDVLRLLFLLDGKEVKPSEGNALYDYAVEIVGVESKKAYRIIICLYRLEPTIGVITLYRIKSYE